MLNPTDGIASKGGSSAKRVLGFHQNPRSTAVAREFKDAFRWLQFRSSRESRVAMALSREALEARGREGGTASENLSRAQI